MAHGPLLNFLLGLFPNGFSGPFPAMFRTLSIIPFDLASKPPKNSSLDIFGRTSKSCEHEASPEILKPFRHATGTFNVEELFQSPHEDRFWPQSQLLCCPDGLPILLDLFAFQFSSPTLEHVQGLEPSTYQPCVFLLQRVPEIERMSQRLCPFQMLFT